jgi:peptidoglycan/xylan/chitin deacetylase (PgdA/CDA1 family)
MAITVDDLPVAPPSRHDLEQQRAITAKLLEVLAAHRVPAIGFVNEAKLEVDGVVDPARVGLLEQWLDRGLELGNHGHSHLSLHRVDPEEWLADVKKGERVSRPLVEARGGNLGWFRHPFLHAGRSAEVQAHTAAELGRMGYRVAPVSIDNSEWVYGAVYADAWNRGDRELMQRIGEDYVRYMLDVVAYYEGQAARIVGDEAFPQILLIHAYALNADWLGTLLERLEARGYRWIPLAEAMQHPAYQRPIDGFAGAGGITWLHRWAITSDMDRSIFAGEPEVPEWIEALRGAD